MNRQINRENYEVFLIDRLEGKLNDEQEAELAVFLADNPDLEEEFNCLNSIREERLEPIAAGEVDFSFLKKPEVAIIREEEMIAAFENDLSEEAYQELQQRLIENPQYQRDFDLFKLSRLQKEEIQFEGKEKLKKKTGIVISLNYTIRAIAAVVLAVILLGVLYEGNKPNEAPSPIAFVEENDNIKASQKTPIIKKPETETQLKEKVKMPIVSHPKNLIFPQEEEPLVLSSKPYQVRVDSAVYTSPQTINSTQYLASKPSMPSQSNEDKEYLKPSEWLWQKMKQQMPQTAYSLADTLGGGGAGSKALNLLAKTTGISIEDRKDAETGTKGFAIVSRYFSYERMTHP